jgi:hypothetical protein
MAAGWLEPWMTETSATIEEAAMSWRLPAALGSARQDGALETLRGTARPDVSAQRTTTTWSVNLPLAPMQRRASPQLVRVAVTVACPSADAR